MSLNLAEQLKKLRKEKGVSQEKLAQYLDVSFQAVSKWENGNTYPDIALLPDIARFYGVTVDELLQVEVIDEKRLYKEYENKAEELFRNGKRSEALMLWQEAYKKMPNNVEVKEMLMSSYYDVDKIEYQNEIIELGTEIYNSDASMYYKGQAISEITNTYAANGNIEMAKKWAAKSVSVFNAKEILFTQIFDGDEMLYDVSFCTYWFFNRLFYMAVRIDNSETISPGKQYKQDAYKTLAKLYEVLYPNADMSFESLAMLVVMHRRISELEIELGNAEDVISKHLAVAAEYAIKSVNVEAHDLKYPLLYGWQVQDAPSDNKQCVRRLKKALADSKWDAYRNKEWFKNAVEKLNEAEYD